MAADRDEARSQLAELKQATASKDLPDAATILSKIRENQEDQPEQRQSRRTKPKAQKVWTLKDIEEVLEAIAQTKNPRRMPEGF